MSNHAQGYLTFIDIQTLNIYYLGKQSYRFTQTRKSIYGYSASAHSSWLRIGPVGQESLYTLMSDGCRHKTALEVLCASAGKKWLCSRSAYTTGGGRFVVWCEANSSGFCTDDTYLPLGIALNNTQKSPGISDISILVKMGIKPGDTRRSDTRLRLDSLTGMIQTRISI